MNDTTTELLTDTPETPNPASASVPTKRKRKPYAPRQNIRAINLPSMVEFTTLDLAKLNNFSITVAFNYIKKQVGLGTIKQVDSRKIKPGRGKKTRIFSRA